MQYMKGKPNPWRVQFFEAGPVGKRIRKSKCFPTKQDAVDFEARINKIQKRRQASLKVCAESTLMLDLAARFLRHRDVLVKNELLVYTTWKNDKERLEATWIPRFGDHPLELISRGDISEELDKLLLGGISPATRNRHRSLMHSFFEFAIDKEMVEFNPVSRIPVLPEKKKTRPHGHWETLEEVARYVKAFYEKTCFAWVPPKRLENGRFVKNQTFFVDAPSRMWGTLAEFLVKTGPRISEATALKWGDVKWDRDYIVVQRIIEIPTRQPKNRTKGQGAGGHYLIPLLPDVRAALIEWRKLSPSNGSHDYIFSDEQGVPIQYERFRKLHGKVIRAAKLKYISPHGLRSTYATNAEKAGMQTKQVQRMLGHESITTTEIYTKRDEETVRLIVARAREVGFGGFAPGNGAHQLHTKTSELASISGGVS